MKALLVISERDNVGTALETLDVGRTITLGSLSITVRQEIPRGHKIAIRPIVAGEPVLKYGSAIGTASDDIPAGAHVHTHNVSSSRGRGDLRSADHAGVARLAEPTDEHSIAADTGPLATRKGA